MRKYVAEFLGTFILVFLGTGTVVIAEGDTLTIGLAFGLAITIMAFTFGKVSGGNFNPAVSLAMIINKRLNLKTGVIYIIMQFLGAITASAVLSVFIQALGLSNTMFGQTDFQQLTAGQAFFVETLITFLFILVILMATSKEYGVGELAPLPIGLILSFLIIVVLNLTGGSLNPARSFGPAIFAGGTAIANYWVYLLAPSIGALAAAFIGKLMGSEE